MLDLGVLKSLLRQINEDERSERHKFAHDGRVAFIDAAPALIAELRELRAEVARVIERFKDAEGEQTLMEVVEAVFLNGEAGWKLAHELQDANRWRPIAEAPPPNRVELWWPYWTNHVVTGFIRQDGLWVSDCQSSDDPELPGPTHWRPLSDPPEAK
jgi:hypothetical protein